MKHPSYRPAGLVLLGLSLLAGCAQYPSGLTKEQWDSLPGYEQQRLMAESRQKVQQLRETANQDKLAAAAANAARAREARETSGR